MRKYAAILVIVVFAGTMMWSRPPQPSTARSSVEPAVAAPSAESVRAFNETFGKEIRRVTATPDFADDLALAGQFVKAARSVGQTDDMVMLLCETAHSLAGRGPGGAVGVGGPGAGEGDDLALAALELLAKHVPARAADCHGKTIRLLERRTQMGKPEQRQAASERLFELLIEDADAAIAARDWENANQHTLKAQRTAAALKWPELIEQADWRAEQVKMRRVADTRVKALHAKLAENPWDGKSIDELVRVLLVELEDVATAQKFVNRSSSEAANKLLPILSESPDVLGAETHRQIGQWYAELAEGASSVGQWQALQMARVHYQRFLERSSGPKPGAAQPPAQAAALGSLRRIEEQLAMLTEAARNRSGARGATVMISWTAAEPIDVYLNGKALIDSAADFKTRTGERGEVKQARAVVRKGDVITVGARRYSGGFALMAVDREGRLVFATDAAGWKTYFPLDEKQWPQPKVAQKARQQQVFANKLPQAQHKPFDPFAAQVFLLTAPHADKGEKVAYFLHTVKESKVTESVGLPLGGAGYIRVPTARGDAILSPASVK